MLLGIGTAQRGPRRVRASRPQTALVLWAGAAAGAAAGVTRGPGDAAPVPFP